MFERFSHKSALAAAALAAAEACQPMPRVEAPQQGDRIQHEAPTTTPESERRITLLLGETPVTFYEHVYGNGPLFFNMHSNETTSVQAAQDTVRQTQGTMLILENNGERNVSFMFNGTQYRVDPNRIFTVAGAEKTLLRLNHRARHLGAQERARLVSEVIRFGNRILDEFNILHKDTVIALHNNTDHAHDHTDSLSIRSFRPGEALAHEAREFQENPDQDKDDFAYVNSEEDYRRLHASGFNVVLYEKNQGTDDGSLIVICSRYGRRYMNIEAQHGHRVIQNTMLTKATETNRRP